MVAARRRRASRRGATLRAQRVRPRRDNSAIGPVRARRRRQAAFLALAATTLLGWLANGPVAVASAPSGATSASSPAVMASGTTFNVLTEFAQPGVLALGDLNVPTIVVSPDAQSAGASGAAFDPHAPPGTCKVKPSKPFKTGRDPGTLYGDATASCNWSQIQWWKASTCIQKLHHFLFIPRWETESGSCDNHENYQHPNNPDFVAYMQGHHACVRTNNTHTWRTVVQMQIKLFGASPTNASFPSASLDSKC